ncbi:hypothetical protein [Alicyclobacillus acidocaldarius]|nr:hypothetical protein [Alicyclobacillus acidocaldarius]
MRNAKPMCAGGYDMVFIAWFIVAFVAAVLIVYFANPRRRE